MTVKIPRQVRVTEAAMSESAIVVTDGEETVLVVRAGLLPCDVMAFLAGGGIAHEVAVPARVPLPLLRRRYMTRLTAMVRLVAS
jgi:hypothetical protein